MNRFSYARMGGFGGPGMLSPAVKGLLIANLIAFGLQMLAHSDLVRLFGLTPSVFWRGFLWQPVTYMFLHGGFTHLLFNMFALWMFGGMLESVWGTKGFLKYYFLTGVGAGLSNCILTPGMSIPIIGASGAVYGLLAAYGILFPNSTIYISFLIPIKAKYLVIIFGAIEFFSSISASGSGIAHLVHLGGLVIGVIYLKRQDMIRWGARQTKGYLRQRSSYQEQKDIDDEEELRQEVDDLLDKINEVGIGNLSDREKKRLEVASAKLRKIYDQHTGH